jgi:uncharacterized protein (TIGR02231 family)
MRRLYCIATLPLLVSAPAWSAEIKAASHLDAVTVFPQGAEVLRSVKIKLEAGEHQIVLTDLPGEAIPSSIRVEGKASGKLELGSVDAKRTFINSEDPAIALSARRKLEDEIEKLRDQRALDDNAIKAAEAQRAYLDNVAKLPSQPVPVGASAPREDWNALFAVIGTRMAEITKTVTEAQLRQRAIDRKIADLQKEAATTAPKQLVRTEVRINAVAGAPLDGTVTIRYQVNSASWSPLYDAKLATGDKATAPKLTLSRRATIAQTTSEDWDDVALTLSTTRPGLATAAPVLEMLNVDYEGPVPQMTTAAPAAPAARGFADKPKKDERTDAAKSVTGGVIADQTALELQSEVNIGAFQTLFAVAGKQTLKSGPEAKRVAISTEDMDASLVIRTVPRLDPTAYLYTKLTLPKTSSPLLAGQVALFRDGTFVGNGQMAALAPGEDHELGFGPDDTVKVKRVSLDYKKGEVGTFTTSRMQERNFEITVRNLHPRAVTVHVIDRIPITTQQDIKIDATFRNPPTRKDYTDRRGTSLWELSIDPDQEKKIGFGYRVTWPTDKNVRYFEQTPEQIMQQNILRF